MSSTWPEQDAVDNWLEENKIEVDHKQAMSLKEAVSKYIISIQNENRVSNSALSGVWDFANGSFGLQHDNFKHDMLLTLSGDFKDDETAMQMLMAIRDKLNKDT